MKVTHMTKPLARLSSRQRAWLFLGGGIGVFVGSFAAWIKATAVFVGTISISGIEGDGKITALTGAVIVAGGWLVLKGQPKRWLSVLGVFAGLIALATTVYDLYHAYTVDVTGKFGDKVQKLGTVSPGWGLYLTFAAAVVALTGALLALRQEQDVAMEAF